MTLVEFLTARLDEDEQVARACERWAPAPWIGAFKQVTSEPSADDIRVIASTPSGDVTRHITRHSPATVLTEVEAGRRIIELHGPEEGQHPDFCWHDKHEMPCPTLRLLALPYADHADYREEWRP